MSQHLSPRAPQTRFATVRLLAVALLLVLFAGACSADGSVELTTAGRAVAAGEQNAAGDSAGDTADADAAADASDAAATEGATDEPSSQPSEATEVAVAGEAFSFDATPAFLAYAADQVETADTFRFEFFQDITGSPLMEMGSRDTPFMTGESAGTTMEMRVDLSSMMGNMPLPGLDPNADLSMNMISDETAMYLNAPLFQAMLSPDGSAIPGLEWMSTIATGWGRIELEALVGNDMLADFGMSSAADSTQLLSLLDSVGEVLDGGASNVRGVPTQIMYATVNLADMTDALGDDAASLDIPADMLDTLPPVNIEVHIDADSYVRRISYTIDMGSMIPEGEGLGNEMIMWQQIDFFDFGQPIDVALPVGAIDITEEFAMLAELGG